MIYNGIKVLGSKYILLSIVVFTSIIVRAQNNPCVSSEKKLDTVTLYWHSRPELVDLLSNEIIWKHPNIHPSRIDQKLVVILKDSVIHKYCTVLESFDTSGIKVDSGNLKDGKGMLKEYNFNGSIQNEYEFIDGNYNGLAKFYDPNGILHSMCYYYGNHESWFEEEMGGKYYTSKSPTCVGLKITFDIKGNPSRIDLTDNKGVELPSELITDSRSWIWCK